LSIPHDQPIPELITRFLALHEGKNNSEVARLVGVDQSTISRWRKRQFPDSLQEATRKKIVAAAGFELPGDDGRALAFAAGVLWGIERDARHIAMTAREARDRLGFSDEQVAASDKGRAHPITPASMDAGTAAVATAASQRGGGRGPAKKKAAS
jgi:hypothetical protein